MSVGRAVNAVAMSRTEPPEPGVEQDKRALQHRRRALHALSSSDCEPHVALTEALLALEARLEELTCYVAQLG